MYFFSALVLYRFDTYSNAWQTVGAVPIAAAAGATMEYDAVRNCLWIIPGALTWYCFNLNTTPLTVGSLVTALAAWTCSAALAPALTTAAGQGAGLEMPQDADCGALCLDSLAATSRSLSTTGTTTSALDTGAEFHAGMIGCYMRFTSGANSGSARVIATIVSPTSLTTTAFGSAMSAGDTYVVEPPGLTTALAASGGSTTTLVAAGSGWTTNVYRDADVVVVAGTGAGQRRRIASNDATTLTIAGAVTGNPRTGVWTTAPDATSTFRIVPSSDFLYYTVGTATTTFYRVDVVATTNTWVVQTVAPATIGSGHSLIHAPASGPFSLYAARGQNVGAAYRYDIGLQVWATLPWLGSEVLFTGANSCQVPGRNRIFVTIGGQQRAYLYNFVTGILEPVTQMPYAVGTAVDGQRARWIKTADGVEFAYVLRAGGQEFFRLPAEWL
jgi:hypothetical protein